MQRNIVPGNPSNPRSFFLFEDMYDLDALNQVRNPNTKKTKTKNGKTEKNAFFWATNAPFCRWKS
eukprot:COSAG06_NODE_54257_length_295_cov_1.270408_1_plen_64_part_10